MVRSRLGGCSVFFASIGCLALVASCGGGKKNSSSDAAAVAALHFLSTPVHNTEVGGTMQYQAALSEPGEAEWILSEGPHGATVQQGGQLTWTPQADQAGEQAFKLIAMVDGHMVEQSFDVNAASAVMQASAHASPTDPNGASVSVDQPLSEVQGAALQIDPGALPPGDPVTISISSMQHPPVPPEAMMVAAADPHAVQPVELRPSGLAFQQPVRLQLPINQALMAMPKLGVKTYDYKTGQWKKVKVLNVDKTAGVVVAEVHHFSPYAVVPELSLVDLSASGGGAACGQSVVVRASLVPKLSEVPAAFVNGWSGSGSSLADVLAGLKEGESLQVYARVKARSLSGGASQGGWWLAFATKQSGGKLKVGLVSDQGASFDLPAGALAATDAELGAWLSGARADLVFGALGDVSGGVALSGEISLYVVPSGADRPPFASANAFATDEVELDALGSTPGDDDCDGAPNAFDATPTGAAPPVLVGLPASPAHAAVGAPAVFKISSPQAGVKFTWSASDPSVTLVSGMDGAIGTATPSVPGLFTLTATGTLDGAKAKFSWDVIADPADVAAQNTPPVVAVTASASVVRAGEPVTLMALGKDAEGAALTFAWLPSDASTLSAQLGDTTVFSAAAPGDYVVGCVASDGAATSAPAKVIITVLSATANRPPGSPTVAPLSEVLTHMPGQGVALMLTAKAEDPDGDALTYDFAPDPATPPTFTLTKSGAGAAFSTTQDGLYVFYVTATDAKGAVGPWTPVKILVTPPISATATDADKDGYPAGLDCNDADATVHPGAAEVCGDGKDQNCDGRDVAAMDCDGDGDRVTPAQGDCDDKNPAIGPKMLERCDGIDNNCDKATDEGFGLGADCSSGVGACAATGKTVCSASFGGVVCGALPGQPAAETCDKVDNDCNGRVDDVAGAATGDVANCGGCNIACPTPANAVAACVMGGCTSKCAAGFADTDRNPANGCECKLTNNGVEICDGMDNDCNGAVDDGVTSLVYEGPAGTLGVGVCSQGLQRCVNGELVPLKPQIVPSPELCDGLDNNCDKRVDEGFDFLTDAKNCGGCGIVCVAGTACQQGRCPGGTVGADGGVGMVDAGAPPDGGGGLPGSLTICTVAGVSTCNDIAQDRNNCGGCGRACAANQYCNGGTCMTAPAITCAGKDQVACQDPAAPEKQYCTDVMNDPRNCGGCGKVCAGACQNGTCPNGTAQDAGATQTGGADAGAPPPVNNCPGNAPTLCPDGAGGSGYCTNVMTDANNCMTCGHVCSAGLACVNGACVQPGAAQQTCGNGLTMCATGCTSLLDDMRNCMTCGQFCDGTCSQGACYFTAGPGAFGATCLKNTDCSGGFCADQGRFGWPNGFCSSLCDNNLPCPNGQVCQGSSSSNGFGFCHKGCATDAECGANFVCNAGACSPKCTVGTNICQSGTTCDATGHCVAGAAPTCQQPQVSCPTPDGRSSYCTETTKDPQNCGGCGRICPAGLGCNNGVCGGTVTCGGSLTSCGNAQTGSYCTDLLRDPQNCGACGKPCGTNAICTNGVCQGGYGTYMGLAVCGGATAVCTNLLADVNNCGACGVKCGAGQGCFGGTCGTMPTVTCPADAMVCKDAGGKEYCANVRFDNANCGRCSNACPAGSVCQNGGCVPGGSVDGGATSCAQPSMMCPGPTGAYCADTRFDFNNCGGCGHVCQANQSCQYGACVVGAAGDGGAQPVPNCPAAMATCVPAAGPGYCADTQNDTNNCGVCFNVCGAGFFCMNATCVPQGGGGPDGGTAQQDAGTAIKCVAPQTACDGTYCTDFMTDKANCGGCHKACNAGDYCNNGVCTLG